MAAGLVALAAVGLVADRHPADAATAARTVGASATPVAVSAPSVASAPENGGLTPVASASAAPAPAATGGTLPDGRVVLNLATEEDLRKLPGLGPKRVQAILELRQRQGGRFRAVADLLRVKGLGRKTLARLAPRLVLDRPPGA